MGIGDVIAEARSGEKMSLLSQVLSWDGWNGVGALAGVVSLATLLIVGYQWQKDRRRFPDIAWVADMLDAPEDDPSTRRLRLANDGGVAARILRIGFVHCEVRAFKVDKTPFHWVVKAFDQSSLLVRSDDFGSAWILLVWVATNDTRHIHLQWMPLLRSGSAADSFNNQMGRTGSTKYDGVIRRVPKRNQPLKARRSGPTTVGPDHKPARVIRAKGNAGTSRAYETAISEMERKGGLWKTEGLDDVGLAISNTVSFD